MTASDSGSLEAPVPLSDQQGGLSAVSPQAPLRSVAPRVFGVLSIVFGCIVFLLSLFGGGMAAATRNPYQGMGMNNQAVERAWEQYQQAIRPATIAQSAVFLIMSIGLVFIGAGQVRYRRWARSASIAWGAAALVCLALVVASQVVWAHPATTAFFQALREANPAGSPGAPMSQAVTSMVSTFSGPVMVVISLLFYTPYPLLLLLLFSRRRYREMMNEPLS